MKKKGVNLLSVVVAPDLKVTLLQSTGYNIPCTTRFCYRDPLNLS